MAIRKQITWEELRVGVFVLVGLIIIAVAIFYITGPSSWGAKYTLKTYLPEVADLQKGAPVTLDGVPVGNVEDMKLNTRTSNRQDSIEIEMSIGKEYQGLIRTSSNASLLTSGLLGNRYVTITRGYAGNVIPDGGVIQGLAGNDLTQMVANGVQLENNVNVVLKKLSDIVDTIHSGKGTAGAFIYDRSIYNHFDSVAADAQALVSGIRSGKGSIGKVLVSDDLYNKFDASATHLESMTNAIQSQQGLIGRLVYDRAFSDKADQLITNANGLIAGVRNGQGTMGKFFTDDSVWTNLRDASANINHLTGKMNNGQGTFGKFFTDPQLYDNLTGLTGDARLLMGDFRRNPKKFLQIHLNIF